MKIDHVSVFTRCFPKRFDIVLSLSGVRPEGEKLKLSVRVLSKTGKIEKQFTDIKTARPPREASPHSIVRLSRPWPQARLWDINDPYLYRLEVRIKNSPFLEYSLRFGFREFRISGRNFYLNGSLIHLRPVNAPQGLMPPEIEKQIDRLIDLGFNMIELWPNKQPDPAWEIWCNAADEKGIAVTAPAGNVWNYLNSWEESGVISEYNKKTGEEIARFGNHPSVLMWGTNGNVFGSGLGMHPESLGRRKDEWHDYFYWRKRRVPKGEEAFRLIKAIDPDRTVFAHHGGGIGDVYTLNMYLNMTPLQEREEWLSSWDCDGEMPLLIVEFGTPVHAALFRGRTDYPQAVTSEPLVTEYAAVSFGPDAYRRESPAYRREIRSRFIAGRRYESWHDSDAINKDPLFQKLQVLFIRNTWRSWRASGISGGMVPWHLQATAWDAPGGKRLLPAGEALRKYNNETLVWIAGKPGTYTEKGHSFYRGEELEKQIMLHNDGRGPLRYSLNWKIEAGGRELSAGKREGRLAAGERTALPLSCRLDTEKTLKRCRGSITVQARMGNREYSDLFEFTMFERPAPVQAELFVYDPEGESSAYLRRLGYSVRNISAEEAGGGLAASTVILGRRACSCREQLPALFECFTSEGGTLLVLAQDPEFLRERMGFRVYRHLSRRIFPVEESHPVFAGLENGDLADFRGESSLVEAYPEYRPGRTRLGKWWFPYYGYHWGNRGSVASTAVEKPHTGSWRPLAECGFDLAYSPLMEMEYGAGRVILCGLDAEGRSIDDPAADILMHNLLAYCRGRRDTASKRGPAELRGGREDAEYLHRLGLIFKTEAAGPADSSLCIIGRNYDYDAEALRLEAEAGRIFFFLPRGDGYPGLGIELEEGQYSGTGIKIPEWDICRGLSPSDIRSRTDIPVKKISDDAEAAIDGMIAEQRHGEGRFILCRFDPEGLAADENTYLRLTRWRHTRVFSQVLANCGAVFASDRLFFEPPQNERVMLNGSWSGETAGPARRTFDLPFVWEDVRDEGFRSADEVLLKKTVMIPRDWAGGPLLLSLGKVDGSDRTFVNGIEVSTEDRKGAWPHNYPRTYLVPAEAVSGTELTVSVLLYERDRQFDSFREGGFAGPAGDMWIQRLQTARDTAYYHHDYREDYLYGDDPCRYFNF